MRLRAILGAALVAACGAAAKPADPPPQPPPSRVAAGDVDVRRLVLEMARSTVCSQLDGKWLGLPAQTNDKLEGADGGLSSSWGRLQIRDCKSTLTDRALTLSFGGIGWTWVDQKSGAVGVKQYVYITANVEMTSALDIGYDPDAKIASVWLTPTEASRARVQALGTIKLVGDGVLGQLEKAAASALGVDPKQQVAAQGAKAFEDALRKGMTLTFDTRSRQVDLMLAALPNGVVPKRPMPALAKPWLVNERQELFAGGVQFSGPYDPQPAIELDANGEGGAPAAFGVVCASDATSAADALARGDKPSLVLQNGGEIAPSGPFKKVLAPPPCPWVLVTSARGADSARFALELTPTDPPAGTAVGTTTTLAPSSATVWITVLGFDFEGRKPDGKAWDFGGGAPDPKIWLRAGSGTKLVIVPTMKDTFRANPMLRAPAAVEVSATSPLVVGATDVDEAFDDPMGEATLTLDDVLAHREMEVEVKLAGLRTGTLRLRFDH